MKMKKMGIILLTLATSLMLTGCWDHNEVNKLAIVIALGVDQIPGPEPILLSAQIVNPATVISKEGGSKEKPFFIASAKGKNLSEAVHRFMEKSPRRFFYSHTAVIVFGDKLARSGIKQTLDFFARERQFRRSIWVLITPKTAQEILQSTLDLEKIPALGIEEMIRQSKKTSIIELVQRSDFIRDLTSKSHSAVISNIDLVSQKANEAKEKTGDEETANKQEESNGKNLKLTGEAVFRKGKLVGYLTERETRGLLWIHGKMKAGPVALQCEEGTDKDVVIAMNSTKSKIIPSYKNGKIQVSITIDADGEFKEVDCPENLGEIEAVKRLEKLTNQKIEQEVKKTIQKAQQLHADIFGIANLIYRDHPEEWANLEKDWDGKFSQMEVDIHVKSIIRQLGVITRPLDIDQ